MKYNFKLIIASFVLLYLVVAILFFNFFKELAINDTKQEALSILNTITALRVYVDKVQRTVLADMQAEGKLDSDFFDERILSASHITKETFEYMLKNQKINYTYRLAATNPTNLNNKTTELEEKVLNRFRNGEIDQYFDILNEDDGKYFYMALPISANSASCMVCHGDPQSAPAGMIEKYGDKNGFYEKIGDIRALISLRVPVANIIEYHKQIFIVCGLVMLCVFVVFVIFIYIFYKKDLNILEKNNKLLLNQNKLAAVGEMLNNIVHQWRQPLAQISSILVNIELRSENNILTKKIIQEKVEEANLQTAYMSNSIEYFRNFFVQKNNIDVYDIKEVFTHVKGLVTAALKESNITLNVIIENNFKLKGSSNDFIQVLINIINNSRDVLAEKNNLQDREIMIRAYTEEKKNIITIEDNGGGIHIAPIEKIFTPYFTTKNVNIGTGLGLYICKEIVEKKNGGKIDVQNKNDGVLFTITLVESDVIETT